MSKKAAKMSRENKPEVRAFDKIKAETASTKNRNETSAQGTTSGVFLLN
jgi:hypothetical protein